jgi:hypothetical protein
MAECSSHTRGKRMDRSSGATVGAGPFNSFKDLALAYQQRKAHGITPYWCGNHGPTTSMYYKDLDGNKIETQVDNLSKEEATAFMMSQEFAENPFGVDFDPEDLVRRVDSGVNEASIKKREKYWTKSCSRSSLRGGVMSAQRVSR